MKFEHVFEIPEDGKMKIRDRLRVARHIAAFFAGCKMVLILCAEKRTSAQNRYLFGQVIEPIKKAQLDVLGNAVKPIDVLDHYKELYIEPTVVTVCGVERLSYRSSKLTRSEFQDFILKIESDPWVIKHGVFWESITEYESRTGETIKGGTI